MRHPVETLTSPVGEWVETCGVAVAGVLYDSAGDRLSTTPSITVNVAQPSFMRAPGECPGTYALECAMDELAVRA